MCSRWGGAETAFRKRFVFFPPLDLEQPRLHAAELGSPAPAHARPADRRRAVRLGPALRSRRGPGHVTGGVGGRDSAPRPGPSGLPSARLPASPPAFEAPAQPGPRLFVPRGPDAAESVRGPVGRGALGFASRRLAESAFSRQCGSVVSYPSTFTSAHKSEVVQSLPFWC